MRLEDCAGCATGNHEAHQRFSMSERGAHIQCDCTGDCIERLARRREEEAERKQSVRREVEEAQQLLLSEGYAVFGPINQDKTTVNVTRADGTIDVYLVQRESAKSPHHD